MYKISCEDLGKDDGFVAEGATKEEAKSKLMAHAMTDHKEMMDTMNQGDKDELMMKIDNILDSQM
jgi:predicted small metal-binding protein